MLLQLGYLLIHFYQVYFNSSEELDDELKGLDYQGPVFLDRTTTRC